MSRTKSYGAKQLRAILDHSSSVIYLKDLEGTTLLVNREYERVTGVAREDAVGRTDHEIYPEDIADAFRSNDLAVIEAGESIEFEEVLERDDGEHYFISRKFPLVDEAGTMYAVGGISTDITRRKRAEAALRRAHDELETRVRERTADLERAKLGLEREMAAKDRAERALRSYLAKLEQSNRDLEEFAYVASHDLQEPLRKIIAFGDRVAQRAGDALDETSLDYLARMQSAASRLQDLIENLLDYSRVTTRARPFEKVDMETVVSEAVSDLEARIVETGGRVEVGALPTLDADATQMRQLFQNLIDNALKYHRTGVPPVVRVDAARDGAARLQDHESGESVDQWLVTVSDNGIGVDDKYADRIFKPFQRLHGRGEYEGTGMGLATCRKIVERHQGKITVESTPGEGTTFRVVLPTEQPTDHGHDEVRERSN